MLPLQREERKIAIKPKRRPTEIDFGKFTDMVMEVAF